MVFALADCNNFFCSCERVFRPALRHRPVVVLSNNDGCIVARSDESKALGLKMGTPAYQVRELLERHGVAVCSSNYTLYGDMSRRVMSMLNRYAPATHVYSVDEAFLDFTGWRGDLAGHCRRMVGDIGRSTGIPVSVGIAPTKTLAKVATRYAKRYAGYRGVCVIDTESRRIRALEEFPITDVWGIGHRVGARLAAMGVETALDFTRLTPERVRRNFTLTGLRTWRELRGESCIPLDELPRRKSICTSRSFPDRGLSRLCDVEEAVATFAARCVGKMRGEQSACRALTLFAYTSRFATGQPSHYIHLTVEFPVATSCLGEVVAAAVGALRREWPGDDLYLFKKAGVIVWDTCDDRHVQLSLFDGADRQKARAVQTAIDAVNARCGRDAIHTATQGTSVKWQLKRQYLSRCFTTRLSDVIEVTAG